MMDAGRNGMHRTSRSTRVGIYSPNYPGLTKAGGIGTYTRHLAHALSELGHRVHVLTPGLSSARIRDAAVTVHLISTHMPLVDRILPGSAGCCTIAAAMNGLVRRYDLDVVEFPNWEGLGLAYTALRRVPVVVRLHTSSLEALEINGRS